METNDFESVADWGMVLKETNDFKSVADWRIVLMETNDFESVADWRMVPMVLSPCFSRRINVEISPLRF